MTNENESLPRSYENMHIKVNDLENKKTVSQNKCDDSHKCLLKLTKAQENLDKLLGSQYMSFTKKGLEFNANNRKRPYKHFFIKETS